MKTKSENGRPRPALWSNRASCPWSCCSSQLAAERKARPATRSCSQGKLLSGCYHGTAPAEPTKQRRTGQACMYIRLPYTAARCSAAVHHLTYLLRDGVTCDACPAETFSFSHTVTDGRSARRSCSRMEQSPGRGFYVASGSTTCVGMNCSTQRALPENAFLWHARTYAHTPSTTCQSLCHPLRLLFGLLRGLWYATACDSHGPCYQRAPGQDDQSIP